MRFRIGALFLLAALVFTSTVPLLADDLPDWMMRPGSVYDARQKESGTHVYLDAVVVDKVKDQSSPAYFTVRECFAPAEKMVILSPPSEQLRLGQLLDVEGDVVVLPNGDRGLENVTVWGYADEDGVTLLTHGGPLIKGLLCRTVWDYMIDLTVESPLRSMFSANRAEMATVPNEVPNTSALPSPTFVPAIADLLSADATQSTRNAPKAEKMAVRSDFVGIGDLSSLSAGDPVELQCKGITEVGTETIGENTYNYLDIIDSSGSIRAYCTEGRLSGVTAVDRVNKIIGQIQNRDETTKVICVDDGPGYSPIAVESPMLQICSAGTVGWARTFSDGVLLPSALSGKVVIADRSDFTGGVLYVEEPDRSSAMRVHYSGSETIARGSILSVTGTVTTDSNGERCIEVGSDGAVAVTSSDVSLAPLGIADKALGGTEFNVLTPGVDTPAGCGLYNIGILTKCWGRVTGVFPVEKCFYIDDGSGLNDGNASGVLGIKVSWAWQAISQENSEVVPPLPGWYITTTGISGIETTSNGGRARVLRLRRQADVYSLADTTAPSPGSALSPAYVNAGPIAVTYSGASDSVSGLAEVELWYKKGHSGTWTYSGCRSTSPSGAFSFPVADESTYYFDLVAEDNAGNRSSAPTGDGDCHTIYETNLSAEGRSFVHNEYLYPGGPIVRTTAYDESGNQVREVSSSYGNEGELLSKSGSTDQVTYSYDAAYHAKSITDAAGRVTSLVYDDDGDPNTQDPKQGYLSRIEYPGGETVTYSDYDAFGHPLTRTDAKSVVTKYIYDDTTGLLTDTKYPATPELNAHYEYDPEFSRLVSVTDATGVTSYAYDDLDLPTSVTTTYTGLPARTIEYQFWPNGNLMAMTTPAGSFSYAYDAAGRPTGLTNPFGQAFSWSYYDNDRLQSQSSPVSGASYAYDSRGFLTSLTNRKTDQTLLSEYVGQAPNSGMSYDSVGNLLSMSANVPGMAAEYSGVTNYSYAGGRSQLLQEKSVRGGGYSHNFAYDPMGNPTTFEGVLKAYNTKNQSTADGFVYDANGNPTTYRDQTLVFDPENRATSFGTVLSAGYNAGGLRAWKQSASGRTYFLYSGSLPVCELNAAGDVAVVDTFGAAGLLARREGSPTQGSDKFYTFDPQGNVSQTLDGSGNVASTHLYDAHGTSLCGAAASPYGFGADYGYYTDQETGLQLLGHRYYDSEEGRFLTRDPIGYAGGMNLYSYADNNPVNSVDPLGLCAAASCELAEMKQIARHVYQQSNVPRVHVPFLVGMWENWKESTAIVPTGGPSNACGAWQGRIGNAFQKMNNGNGPTHWDVRYASFMGGVHAWIEVVPKNSFSGSFNPEGYRVDPWIYNDPDFRPND